MKIQWVEDICNKGGLSANDRALMRKLADEIYRLKEGASQLVDSSVDQNNLNQQKIRDLERVCQELAHSKQSLMLEVEHLRSQVRFNQAVQEEEPKKKRSKKNFDDRDWETRSKSLIFC